MDCHCGIFFRLMQTELKFRAGDRIRIFGEMDEDGFYAGQLESSGRRGLVPSNFLRELPRSSASIAEPNTRFTNGGVSEGGRDNHDSRRKTICGESGSRSTYSSKNSHARNRSRPQSDEVDPDFVARRRRSERRTREVGFYHRKKRLFFK